MRQKLLLAIAFFMLVAGCGLKVPADQVQGQLTDDRLSGATEGDLASDGGSSAVGEALDGDSGTSAGSDGPGASASGVGSGVGGEAGSAVAESTSLFPNNLEGVTSDTIKICTHVPITGAAPVDRNPERFGGFYFDWLNREQGGIHRRKVDYVVFDDRYNPANAVQAAERCRSAGAFFIAGAAGTDQLVAVAKWARDKKVPYLMGPASVRDVNQYTPYAKMVGPDYEFQHQLLADFLVKKFGKSVNYAMIRIDSPFFDAAHDAFVDRLAQHGVQLAVDEVVQKDENLFSGIYAKLRTNNVKVVNNFTTPVIWLKMMKQRPADYRPTWTAVSPAAGFNLVAEILTGEGGEAGQAGDALVFHHFNPAYPATRTDSGSTVDRYPYAAEIRRFQQIFATCRECQEEKTPRDDIDWSGYLAAKAIHRILEKVGPELSRTKLWTFLDSYKETPQEASPACPADFTRQAHRGAWHVNVFELGTREWTNVEQCVDRV